MDIHVIFGPVDRNPGFVYQITIRDRTGELLLCTSKAPDTGEDLRTAADCLRVAHMYAH